MTFAQKNLEAAQLMLKGDYPAVVTLYTQMAEEFPEHLGTCQAQLATINFVMKNYDKALELFDLALKNGVEKTQAIQESIQATRDAIAKRAAR